MKSDRAAWCNLWTRGGRKTNMSIQSKICLWPLIPNTQYLLFSTGRLVSTSGEAEPYHLCVNWRKETKNWKLQSQWVLPYQWPLHSGIMWVSLSHTGTQICNLLLCWTHIHLRQPEKAWGLTWTLDLRLVNNVYFLYCFLFSFFFGACWTKIFKKKTSFCCFIFTVGSL